jgi:hypothetical protein
MKHIGANLLSGIFSAKESVHFRNATRDVKAAQTAILQKTLSENKLTACGKTYKFETINSYREYRQRVPLVEYDDIRPSIDRILAGEADILFAGRPLCLQPTSGTTSGRKFIPFNHALRKQFQRGVATWIFDLFAHEHGLVAGKWFWSLSPVGMQAQSGQTKVPVGFLDDTGYLGPVLGPLLKKSFAVPSEAATIQDSETFRYVSMAFLLKEADLVLISIWNPSYFALLLESIDNNITGIIRDIHTGHLSLDTRTPEKLRGYLQRQFGGANRSRAMELDTLFQKYADRKAQLYKGIWPRLRLLSLWEDAEAKGPAARLGRLFPSVFIQPKGLIATEGMVSIPLFRPIQRLLSIRCHFYEFIPVENETEAVPAWKLDAGRYYKVVVTTAGGLYRYKLNDIVKVRGFFNECPCLEFHGRGNQTSDFYGEKLHQLFVAKIINTVLTDMDVSAYFILLAPDGVGHVDHYTLYIACDSPITRVKLDEIREQFETELKKNIHYDYCKTLGQLRDMEICHIHQSVDWANSIFLSVMKNRGLKDGDIKPAVLDNQPVWKKEFSIQ